MNYQIEAYGKRSLPKRTNQEAVNLKKTSGGHTADNRAIAAAAVENEQLLHKQLALYASDIIICCGTADAFVRSYFPDEQPQWQRTS